MKTKPAMLHSSIDPHWSAPVGFEKYRAEAERIYKELEKDGIEFRGYRFWPPFFCFNCGRGISASQWCFARVCCDSALGYYRHMRIRRIFAGRVEIDPATKDDPSSIVERTEAAGGFLDPRSGEGFRLSQQAQAIKSLPKPPKSLISKLPSWPFRRPLQPWISCRCTDKENIAGIGHQLEWAEIPDNGVQKQKGRTK